MDAEGAALAHDAIEEKGGGLRDGVVIDEELLELVDDEERAGHGFGAAPALVAGNVLHAEPPEDIAAPLQFLIHALEHAEGKLAVALDGDDTGVGQPLLRVALELHAFFEV